MIAVRVSKDLRLAVVGSPDYFKSHSIPRNPRDLKDHACIGFRFTSGVYRWEFEKGRRALTVNPRGPATFDDPELVIQAVLSGMGIRHLARTDPPRRDRERPAGSGLARLVSGLPGLFSLLPKPPQSTRRARGAHRHASPARLRRRRQERDPGDSVTSESVPGAAAERRGASDDRAMMKLQKLIATLMAGCLLAGSAGAQVSYPAPPGPPADKSAGVARKGSWTTIENLPQGTLLQVKSALANGNTQTVNCQFLSAEDTALVCQPWSRPRPFWYPTRSYPDQYVFSRARVVEVRIENEDAQRGASTIIGTLAGGVVGGVLGYNCCNQNGNTRPGGAIGFSLIGALVGGVAGHAMPFVRGLLIYRR